MKKLLLLFAMAALMSACVKQPEPPKQIRFSILGDSYSTFEGYVHPETNDVYPFDSIGVTNVEQMWWHKVTVEKGWILDVNNSFSGSLVCNYNYAYYYGPHSFLHRMDDLGQPDVIFIFGATNDACAHDSDNVPVVPLGNDVFSDWTEDQLCTFRPALSYLFENLQQRYPNAELYFLLDMNLGSNGIDADRRDAFIGSIHRIANHYNVKCIDLEGIKKSYWHPNAEGHGIIAEQVLDFLETEAI